MMLHSREFAPLVGRASIAIVSMAALSSCSLAAEGACHRRNYSAASLISTVADRLADRVRYSKDQNAIKYASGSDLIKKNPLCCFVYENNIATTGDIHFPAAHEITVMVYYKKYSAGDRRYFKSFTDLGPCPENFEDGGTREADKYHELYMGKKHA